MSQFEHEAEQRSQHAEMLRRFSQIDAALVPRPEVEDIERRVGKKAI